MKQDLSKYKSFTIIGAARSGIAAADLLHSKGYTVFLSESNSEDKIKQEYIDSIGSLGIKYEFGGHSEKIFKSDVIVLSPGVPQNSFVVKEAIKRKIELISEIELAYWFSNGKIAAITGTNGKTTTTTLIGEILSDAGFDTVVSGNIGNAYSDNVEKLHEDSVSVLELSSFQLDNIKQFKPDVAVLMNITPDHMDRYDNDLEKYTSSKFRIVMNQDKKCRFIYNYDDSKISERVSKVTISELVPFSIKEDISHDFRICSFLKDGSVIYYETGSYEEVVRTSKLNIKGPHNIYNSMASVLTAKFFGVSTDSIRNTLIKFKGVEHRIEFVREVNGIKFYNDSKATNVDSVWYALQGFNEPIVLILGGRDKGNDYTKIENEVKNNVKCIIAVGESGQKVYNFFNRHLPVYQSESFEDCISKAYTHASQGDVILLSPACASFDMFESYEHRGKEFKRIVSSLN